MSIAWVIASFVVGLIAGIPAGIMLGSKLQRDVIEGELGRQGYRIWTDEKTNQIRIRDER